MMRRPLSIALVCAALVATVFAADEGWVIDRFASEILPDADGSFVAREVLEVDFAALTRHGIFRDLVYTQRYDDRHNRVYPIALMGVTDGRGRHQPVDTSSTEPITRFRIGDPDRTVTGTQTYHVNYRVGRALNAFADHDELYWNVTGTWPVRVAAASVLVRVPAGGITNALCFQGGQGSKEACTATETDSSATFTVTRPLDAGEQMTIVVFFRKGVFPAPQPLLVARARGSADYFDTDPKILAATGGLFAIIVAGVALLWWRFGRDRRFVSMHYLSQNSDEERMPLFASDPIVVEFAPPDKIRPGQMGLLLDERADTLDATATIIDLAVRGYLTITEIPKQGWFGHVDWQLDQGKKPDAALLDYERILLDGLFSSESSRKLSDLKNVFYRDLDRAKDALYKDAVSRGWFPRNPNIVRGWSMAAGVFTAFAGVGLVIFLGSHWGAGLVGLPIAVGGVLFMIASQAMPRRTATGHEAMRRSLGFRRYVTTAETHQSAFAERAVIFTQYLPYAIVFRCVDRWARAFKDIDLQRATAGFYAASASSFDANSFSSNLSGFSSSMSTTLSSTPGGSGGSGSGGSSGGGGGGGGGGSW
ncbi:MAG TPA: DUF2207 domain-containing protein [Vicinamibacterales bacterium]|nr:DUF2207 domain-containing protein [Vicinamibacterales bacterium]